MWEFEEELEGCALLKIGLSDQKVLADIWFRFLSFYSEGIRLCESFFTRITKAWHLTKIGLYFWMYKNTPQWSKNIVFVH